MGVVAAWPWGVSDTRALEPRPAPLLVLGCVTRSALCQSPPRVSHSIAVDVALLGARQGWPYLMGYFLALGLALARWVVFLTAARALALVIRFFSVVMAWAAASTAGFITSITG